MCQGATVCPPHRVLLRAQLHATDNLLAISGELKRAKVLDEIDRDKAEGEKLRKKLELEIEPSRVYAANLEMIRFKVGAETAAAVLQLRQQLDALLAQKVAHPDTDLSRAGAALIDGVTRLMGGGGGGGGGGEEKPSKVLAMYGAER